jgi:branched-subunit amino acid ABC-type transport system permease component
MTNLWAISHFFWHYLFAILVALWVLAHGASWLMTRGPKRTFAKFPQLKIVVAVLATLLVIAAGIEYIIGLVVTIFTFWPGTIILILLFWGGGKPTAEMLGRVWAWAIVKPPKPPSEYDRKWDRELSK